MREGVGGTQSVKVARTDFVWQKESWGSGDGLEEGCVMEHRGQGLLPPSRALTAPSRCLAVLSELSPIADSSGLPTWVYSHKDFWGI